MLRRMRHIHPTLQAAINFTLVEERATVGWNLVLYATVPPVSWMQLPLKEQRVFMQVAQLESP